MYCVMIDNFDQPWLTSDLKKLRAFWSRPLVDLLGITFLSVLLSVSMTIESRNVKCRGILCYWYRLQTNVQTQRLEWRLEYPDLKLANDWRERKVIPNVFHQHMAAIFYNIIEYTILYLAIINGFVSLCPCLVSVIATSGGIFCCICLTCFCFLHRFGFCRIWHSPPLPP